MSAVCPACGVPVVPGYVKCPKCHAGLPYGSGRRGRATIDPGGTAVKRAGGIPVAAVVIALAVAVSVALWLGLRRGDGRAAATDSPDPPRLQALPQDRPTTTVVDPNAAEPVPLPAAPTVAEVTREIALELNKQRLWGTVEVIGARVDIRSGACRDPAMAPLMDSAVQPLRRFGASKLRCVDKGGAVVVERDL